MTNSNKQNIVDNVNYLLNLTPNKKINIQSKI